VNINKKKGSCPFSQKINSIFKTTTKTNKPRGLSPRANYTDLGGVSVNFCGHVVSVKDPYGRILDFLDRSSYFLFQFLLNCTHEAEWTQLQTRYFSENLVEPGIEHRPLDL
jgi:hypothetical protein